MLQLLQYLNYNHKRLNSTFVILEDIYDTQTKAMKDAEANKANLKKELEGLKEKLKEKQDWIGHLRSLKSRWIAEDAAKEAAAKQAEDKPHPLKV